VWKGAREKIGGSQPKRAVRLKEKKIETRDAIKKKGRCKVKMLSDQVPDRRRKKKKREKGVRGKAFVH